MGWVLATAGALLLGVITNLTYDLIKNGTLRLPAALDRRSLPVAARQHDPGGDGLVTFVTWSRDRPLTPATLDTSYVQVLDRPHVLRDEAWDGAVAEFTAQGKAGRTAYIAQIEVDTGEHEHARKLRVAIAESRYAECLAAKWAAADPGTVARVAVATRRGVREFARVAPPTMVSVSVSVLSREGTLLALRRSLSVETFPGEWTIGINESMKYNDEPGAAEDFFTLVRRGMKEELGLGEADYGPIAVTWLGWSQRAMCWALVALVRSGLSSGEIEERRAQCHSVYEHDLVRWIPFTRTALAGVILGRTSRHVPGPWSYLAPLVAAESWRNRQQI